MEFVFRRHHYWQIIDDLLPPPSQRSHQSEDRNLLALSEIHLACEPQLQKIIRGIKAAKDAWKALESTSRAKTYVKVKQMLEGFNKSTKLSTKPANNEFNVSKDAVNDLASFG